MVVRTVSRTGSVGRFAAPPKKDLTIMPGSVSAINIKTKTDTAMAEQLTAKLLSAFEEVGLNEKGKAAVVQEVNNYLRLGRKQITDEDVAALRSRIVTFLQGGGPTRCTMVAYKRALADADEWGRLYAFIDKEHLDKDKLKREADAEKRKAVQEFQQHQLEEEDAKHKQQAAEELAWAKHLDADVKKWQHAEAEKNAKREEATSRLKMSVAGQLAERQEQKRLAAALKLQEERCSAADMAAELKAKMEAEAAEIVRAKNELRTLLSANEVNKAIKEEQRQKDQALDRKYARQYAEKLDNEEKARLAQLAKRAEYQDRQAAIAQDLPESKRWIDPAIIERNFKAREEKDAAEESMRRQKAKDAQNHFREELADQIKGRQLARNKAKAEHVAEDVAMEVAYKVQCAKAEAEKQIQAVKKEALRQSREIQLREAISRKLSVEAAMTQTEREINADTLRKMHASNPATMHTAFVL